MPRSRTVAAVSAALALAACGKPHASPASSSAVAAAPAAAASVAPAAPPPSARDLADRLAKPDAFDLMDQGYLADGGLSCTPPGQGDAFAMRCRALLKDSGRAGAPAIVEIQLFDQDTDFAGLDAPLKAHIASLNQNWTLDNEPDITLTQKSTGTKTKLPAACHQALGRRNSPAYCALMQTPRILIITGVRPLNAQTRELTMSTGDAPSDSDRDVDHASDLAMLVLARISAQM